MSKSHGGKRTGAGRKRLFDEPTTTIACPKTLAPEVRSMIAEILEFKKVKQSPSFFAGAAIDPPASSRPLALNSVPAGFPSPADDYVESQLDLNEYFVRHPSATFYWKVSGESMNLAGILDGCILLVDRSIEPQHNDVVLATVNGDVTVKRFVRAGIFFELRPESTSDDYSALRFKRTDDIEIWGVVSAAFNKFR